jgi:hypothetical protein
MSIYDYITIDLPTFPHSGLLFQTYLDVEDSYADWYRVDESGRLFRLTEQAGGSSDPRYVFAAPPHLSAYTDPRLEVHADGPDDGPSMLLSFIDGRLVDWRYHPDFPEPS